MRNIIKTLLCLITTVVVTYPTAAMSLSPDQRFEIERRFYYDQTDCAAGSGGFAGNTTNLNSVTATQGETYFLGDSLGVGLDKFGGLSNKLDSKGYPNKLNSNAGRSISSPGIQNGGGSFRNAIEAIQDDREYIASASNVIIALGTNLENDFTKQQQLLVDKIKSINQTAAIYWVDIAAVGTGSYPKDQAQGQNIVMYDNASKLGYSTLSQFKLVWGEDQDPRTLSTKSMPDSGGLLSADGIHFSGADAYSKYAQYLADELSSTAPSGNTSKPAGPCGICSVGGGSGGTGGTTPTTDEQLVGSSNEEKIFNYLISQGPGLNAVQAAGIMGNLKAESGYNPAIVEIGNGIGFGIAQWSFGRRTALEAAAKEKGVSPSSLLFQLDFLVNESRSRQSLDYLGQSEWDGLKNVQTVEEAVVYWEKNFERPLRPGQPIRTQFARDVLVKPYASNAPGATPSLGSSSGCQSSSKNRSIAVIELFIDTKTKSRSQFNSISRKV